MTKTVGLPDPVPEEVSPRSGTVQPCIRAGLGFSTLFLTVVSIGVAYLGVLLFTSLLRPYRFPAPYAVPIFDGPFALIAIAVGYLCMERHRLRQDFRSASLGLTLWLTGLLALAHILAQPDYPGTPGMNGGVAPYFFFLSYLAGLAGIGLATRHGDRSFVLSDRTRLWIGAGVLGLAVGIVIAVVQVRPLLPSLVTQPGRLTPFAVWVAGACTGVFGAWALLSARRRLSANEDDRFARPLLLVSVVWLIGLAGFLIFPYRYGVGWYIAGLARPTGVVVIFVGLIREQLWLYREARARQRDLESLHASGQAPVTSLDLKRLQETQAQLIQADKLKALGTLLSGVAHELNNPLSTVLLSAQLLKMDSSLPEAVRRRLNTMEQESERAARIIKDLLIFARRKPPERRRVSLNEVVSAALALQGPEFDLNRIRVTQELDPTLPDIWADSYQLQQVLLNLLGNATHSMKATHGKGNLAIRTFHAQGEVWVQVDDDGPGIPAAHLSSIFDPFFTTKGPGEGMGLGLTLSYGIVESHGGKMAVENVPGSGARFTIRLAIGAGVEPVTPPLRKRLAGGREARVLVVEDEERLRDVFTEIFSFLGHRVEGAATGQDAMARLKRQDYDLVTLDLRLPDIDGKTVWRWIQEQKPSLAPRVIFATGDTTSPETERFLDEAGRPVLKKPMTAEQVRATIEGVLAETSPAIA